MSFTEKLLYCNNCKKSFTFTVEEQQYRSSQGYPNDPINCPTCRRARNNRAFTHANEDEDCNSRRQMFPVVCTQCGKAVRVPFQPRPGKPVYCSNCQMKTRVGR
ncbi:MAG: zinc-ribbon domain containing protein [Dehalococcoidales bacterium]|nr:zinc-ribbon domain containing protein [Dehalococcoidales bacterium]